MINLGMYSGGFLRPASQSSIVLKGIPICSEKSFLLIPVCARSSRILSFASI